jgi:hypothetical protein
MAGPTGEIPAQGPCRKYVLSLLPLCVTPTPTAGFSHLFVVSVQQALWLAYVHKGFFSSFAGGTV